MRSMCSTVLFSLTESRTSFHAPPCSLKTSFCGSVNRMAVSCQWMFIVLSCAVEMSVAARPPLRILADSSAGALWGVGGTARSLFGPPPSCPRLPPLPGASSLCLDGGARPAVADAPEYPQESAVAAARRRTSTARIRDLFDRRELPRCSWPACRSRGDGPPRPATLRRIGFPELKPHDLRHGVALEVYEQHHDLEEVRALLGHARIDTTQIYTTIEPSQLKRAVSFYDA